MTTGMAMAEDHREAEADAAARPLHRYGIFAGRVVDTRREGSGDDSPHYQVHLIDDTGSRMRVAVNVRSQLSPPDLLYLVDDDFRHPVTDALPAAGSGWAELPPVRSAVANLDYIRGNLFDRTDLRILPADVAGEDNDLADIFDHHLRRAAGRHDVAVYAIGERWGPEGRPDKIFGFSPGNGVHDIHMNQGNSGRFAGDDGVWQDGGMLVHFEATDRWVALFLAFQSQSWHTDDVTGHALETGPQTGGGPEVRVLAALVNPVGGAPEPETVTLLNASPDPVDLTGWTLADRRGATCPVPAGVLEAGGTLVVPTADGVALANRGGTITLLDAAGLKVHGVSYAADDARREGWTLTF